MSPVKEDPQRATGSLKMVLQGRGCGSTQDMHDIVEDQHILLTGILVLIFCQTQITRQVEVLVKTVTHFRKSIRDMKR